MQVWQIIAICVAVAILAFAGWWIYERNRSTRLRGRLGSEYDRLVATFGDRRRAESELARSETRVRKLKVRALSASGRENFLDQWRLCQARFVDDPAGAVEEADRILIDIMRARGYAVDDPYVRLTDICAAYPHHASAYHEANDIMIQYRRGESSTEGLRKAFINFRSFFDEILGGQDEELKRAA
jgi:hypothetical protein